MNCLLCLETFAKGTEHEQILNHPVHHKCLQEFREKFGRECQARDAILLLYQKWAGKKQAKHPAMYSIFCPLCTELVSDLLGDMEYIGDLLTHSSCLAKWEGENGKELSFAELLEMLFRLNLEEMK